MILIFLAGCSSQTYSTTTLAVTSETLPTANNTPNNTTSPTLEPTPTLTPTSFPFVSQTAATPTPHIIHLTATPALPEFSFNGQIVFAVKSTNHSALWLSSATDLQPELLLDEAGVSFLQPLLSPNGDLVAYIRYANETQSIWVLDLTTREVTQWGETFWVSYRTLQETRQASSGLELQAWFPDETKLIYREWKQDTPLNEPVWSYVLSANGVEKFLGSRIIDLTWSPNNAQEVIYLSQRAGVYQVDLSKTFDPQLIIEIPDLMSGAISWHPNGKTVAIVEGFYDSTPLFLLDLETMELQKIESNKLDRAWIRWSSNGKMLFVKYHESIELITFDLNDLNFGNSFVTISHITPVINIRQQLWLENSNYFGLVEGGDTVPGDRDNLCFYSIVGDKVTCLLEAENILEYLGEDDPLTQVAITWSP